MNGQPDVISLNGKRFVTGLFWQPLTQPRTFLKEARDIGRREGMDVVAIRKGRVLQAGFARKSPTYAGAYSLAATLAGLLGDDWIGVFEVDADADRYAIVGTKKGAIIPGCDVIGSRDDVQDRLNSDYNLHRFERVICPSDFGFGGEEKALADVLASGKLLNEYKLAALESGLRTRKLVLASFGMLALAGVVLGGLAWHQRQKALEVEAQARAQQLATAAAEQGQQSAASSAAPLPHPWATQPVAPAFRRACVDAIGGVPLSLGGWLVESAQCDGNALQLTFKRSGNTTNDSLTRAAATSGYTLNQIDEAGETAQLSLPLVALPSGGDDALESLGAVTGTVKSVLQARMIAYSMALKPPPPPPQALPGETPPPAPPPPDWQTTTLTVTGAHTPETVLVGIDTLPGMRLTSIAVKRTESSLEWTLTGEVNGK